MMDWTLIWYGVASMKSRCNDVTVHFGELQKRTFFTSTLTTVEDLKRAIRDWFNYFCQYGRCPEEHGR
jgi:hypothetical protein